MMDTKQFIVPEEQSRTARVLGTDAVRRLSGARVAVFGVGGVGGHLCEALARSGIGHITLVDKDTVSLSNINRQAVAYHSTVGRPKVDVMRERILDVNPDCEVEAVQTFYLPENADSFDLSRFDFVADAVDSIPAKVELAVRCDSLSIPLISAMGAGNKCHPELFRVADLSKTATDPLARVMRRELGRKGIRHLTVVYSEEQPISTVSDEGDRAPGSLSFVPGVMGMIMAGEIIRRLTGIK
ncbi:MAG: tRNA threonylcarbamoyladenosine dehydratase [Clostridia bacterium]|nr:tRNA threonylcarbamoyladenosine dehydratase [Clostridia bacterium]